MLEPESRNRQPACGDSVYCRYKDHVSFHNCNPLIMSPERRIRYGRLIYECPQYIIIVSDEKDEPPTLKGGDSKASGQVIIRSNIVDLQRIT